MTNVSISNKAMLKSRLESFCNYKPRISSSPEVYEKGLRFHIGTSAWGITDAAFSIHKYGLVCLIQRQNLVKKFRMQMFK